MVSYQVEGQVHVCHLPGNEMAPGCTMGKVQASEGSVMLWAMSSWETLNHGFHMDAILIRTTYHQELLQDALIATIIPNICDLFNAPCYTAKKLSEERQSIKGVAFAFTCPKF